MTHQDDMDNDLRKLFLEVRHRYASTLNDVEGDVMDLMMELVHEAYGRGYDRHSRVFRADNSLLCRNMNDCEGGPLGPDHVCKFSLVF